MKQITLLIVTTALTVLLAVRTRARLFQQNLTVDPKLLEMSHPIDGRIDIDFLKENFGPAYE